jgi:uncharacterized OB-fold protein
MTRIVDREFPVDPGGLLPPRTKDSEPFWSALEQGAMVLQRCGQCRSFRYPIAPVCPRCSGAGFAWEAASGRGAIFSRVVYRRNYLPEFEPLIPYVVASVQLVEGPRMFGLIRDRHEPPDIGAPVYLEIERWPDGRCVPAFRCSGDKE